MMFETDHVADIIRRVAAEKIVPRFQNLAAHEVRSKATPTDLATIADDEAEEELTRILKDLIGGSQVVGEEAVSSGHVSRDILMDKSATVWVIDPVDGTGNFARGEEIFGTMVSLVRGGETIMSWIYQIPNDRMIIGEKGAGVWIDDNKVDLNGINRAGADDDFSTMKAFVSRKFIPPHMRPHVDKQTKRLKDAKTYMCCAWEYVMLLEGQAAFSLYKRIEPWDHMAGVLLLEEAGFHVRKWDDTPYVAGDLEGGLINAPNEGLWNRVRETFIAAPMRQVQSKS